ncbi:Uncharacterised protein [Bordetella pertussis]|nr:Uncharacterised protein [Bordetella pertussis]
MRLALIMISPTWGPRRSSVCMASGMPWKFCRPLSTLPMRLARPPARIRPVMSFLSIMRVACIHQARWRQYRRPPVGRSGARWGGSAKIGLWPPPWRAPLCRTPIEGPNGRL